MTAVNQPNRMSNPDITAAFAAAKASAVMVIEELTGPQWGGFDPDALRKAEAAMAEGWHAKTGSKWKTMPELMLRYRAMEIINKRLAARALIGQD
jgi:hypothetical protein